MKILLPLFLKCSTWNNGREPLMALTLKDLIRMANSLSDDMIPDDEVKEFINDAIAAINIEVKADFPFLKDDNDSHVLPEKWQRMLLVPYAKGRIKEQDSSQFEWEVGYEQFFTNLLEFKTHYIIPDEYKDIDSPGNVSEKSIIDNVPYGWGGW